jgi:hypothetical protein
MRVRGSAGQQDDKIRCSFLFLWVSAHDARVAAAPHQMPTRTPPGSSTRPHRIDLPCSVWLPEPGQDPGHFSEPGPERLLPDWAIDRIRTQLLVTRRAPGDAAVLHRLAARPEGADEPDESLPAPDSLLVELAPDTDPFDAGDLDEILARTRRRLDPGGLLLVAVRPGPHFGGEVGESPGLLVARAQAGGFTYLQHLVVADHTPAPSPCTGAHPDRGTAHQPIHTDLLLLQF